MTSLSHLPAGVGAGRDGTYNPSTGGHKSDCRPSSFDPSQPSGGGGGPPGGSRLQQHRESNEYASIWEWPLPSVPQQSIGVDSLHGCGGGGGGVGDGGYTVDAHGYYGTYQTRQLADAGARQDGTSANETDHAYQRPDNTATLLLGAVPPAPAVGMGVQLGGGAMDGGGVGGSGGGGGATTVLLSRYFDLDGAVDKRARTGLLQSTCGDVHVVNAYVDGETITCDRYSN